jgi:hypothetical protein
MQQRTGQPGTQQPKSYAHLTACGARQELTEGQDIREGGFPEPAAALDEFSPDVAKMCDRAPKRGKTKLQEGKKHVRHWQWGMHRPRPVKRMARFTVKRLRRRGAFANRTERVV